MLLFQQLVVGSETDNLGTSIVPDSTVQTDTLKLNVNDSTVIAVDSLQSDTTAESDEVIKSKIKYHAKDSIRVNLENEIVYLYGEATVDYEDLHLEADYIVIDMQNKELFAEGTKDSSGVLKGSPNFSQAEQKFRSNSIRYNFQTKKGRINYVITLEGDGFIHGEVVKKIRKIIFTSRMVSIQLVISTHRILPLHPGD